MSKLKPQIASSLNIPAILLVLAFAVNISGGEALAENATVPKVDKEQNVESESGKEKAESDKEPNNSNPTIADVQKFYNAGNYRAVLAAADKMKPTMMTHYYKGLALQATNQNYRAAIQYNYVKNNAKDQKLKYNASKALSSLYKRKKSTKKHWYAEKHRLDEYDRYGEPGTNPSTTNLYKRKVRRERAAERQRRNQKKYWKLPK